VRIPAPCRPAGLGPVLDRIGEIKARFPRPASFRAALSAAAATSTPGLEQLISEAATRHGLDASVLSALIQVESGGRTDAISPAGALGLAQLMPATARRLGVTDPFDPRANVEAGARYLSEQLARFGDLPSALAAYNAGPAAVARYGGVPPYAETRNFVSRVLELAAVYAARQHQAR